MGNKYINYFLVGYEYQLDIDKVSHLYLYLDSNSNEIGISSFSNVSLRARKYMNFFKFDDKIFKSLAEANIESASLKKFPNSISYVLPDDIIRDILYEFKMLTKEYNYSEFEAAYYINNEYLDKLKNNGLVKKLKLKDE